MIQRHILIVEDDALVGGLLAESLTHRGFVAQSAVSAVDAKRVLRSADPDAALIDIDLGAGPSGLELLDFLTRTRPDIALILLTQRASLGDTAQLPDGVAFLRKSKISDIDYLVDVLEETLRGRDTAVRHSDDEGGIGSLTKTQREVLRLIALGHSNARIAEIRGTTLSGTEQAVGAVFKALGLSESDPIAPRVEAARRYIRAEGLPERL